MLLRYMCCMKKLSGAHLFILHNVTHCSVAESTLPDFLIAPRGTSSEIFRCYLASGCHFRVVSVFVV